MEDNNLPVTAFESDIARRLDRIGSIIRGGCALTSDFKEMTCAVAGMNVEIERLHAQLAAYSINADMRLQLMSAKAPIIEKQLDRMAQRLDDITDRIIKLSDTNLDEADLKRQGMLLEALSRANESFNNVIMQFMMC